MMVEMPSRVTSYYVSHATQYHATQFRNAHEITCLLGY